MLLELLLFEQIERVFALVVLQVLKHLLLLSFQIFRQLVKDVLKHVGRLGSFHLFSIMETLHNL